MKHKLLLLILELCNIYILYKSKYIRIVLSPTQHDTNMPIQKYGISLSATERKQLAKIVKSGAMPARTILRANILLAMDKNGKKVSMPL